MSKWVIAFGVVALLVLALFSSPWWHDKYFGVARNEATAVAVLRKINALESRYAAGHTGRGFTCELAGLREMQAREQPGDSSTDWLSGEWSGYQFTLTGCSADADGLVSSYNVTAVPLKWHWTGVRAFCTDQSGKIFYDLEGSPDRCVTSRNLLE
jgi:hypothetical protein